MISRRYSVKSELEVFIDEYFDDMNMLRDLKESIIGFRLIEYNKIEKFGKSYARFVFYQDIDISFVYSKY